jgi:ribosomal protein S18 acetylase RimI-like enzyme
MLSEPYSLRLFQASDLARLQEITIQTFGAVSIDRNMEELFGPFGAGWAARKAAAIAEDCRLQPDGVFVVVDGADLIVGFITTRLRHSSQVGWIPNMAVDAEHQAKGLGRAMLEHALEFLRERGMQVARIETLEQNPIGQKLYPRLGFVPVASQIHYAMRLDGEVDRRS